MVEESKDSGTFLAVASSKSVDYKMRITYLSCLVTSRVMVQITGIHVPDFQRGVAPRTPKEKFNKIHSSKCNVIERAFGVWKMKWQILLKMPNYLVETQKMIVAATMTLHNYVRYHDKGDLHFLQVDRDPSYVPTIPSRYQRYAIPPNASDASTSEASDKDMDRFCNRLATDIALGW